MPAREMFEKLDEELAMRSNNVEILDIENKEEK